MSVPLNLVTGVKNLVDLYSAVVNGGASAGRTFVVGYQSRLNRYSMNADLTGPVSSPIRLDKSMLESEANKHASPLQCWVDDLIGFLDKLRDCFTPDVIDMLAGDRSEKVELEHACERTYVQALYETIDFLTQMTDVFICQVAAYADETPNEKCRSGPSPLDFETIDMVDENSGEVLTLSIDLSPGGWILSRAIDLTDDWCQLKHELQKGTLPLYLSEEVSTALVRAGTMKGFGLTRAQELLLAAGEKAFQILSLLESLRTIAQDKERLIKSPRLVEDSGIVAIVEELERIPCQDVDSDGRVASGSFGRAAGCIRSFLRDTRGFLHELACVQDEPDILRTCERWFTPRDFQNLGLRATIAINEAIMSYWWPEVVFAADSANAAPAVAPKRKRGRPKGSVLNQNDARVERLWTAAYKKNPKLTKKAFFANSPQGVTFSEMGYRTPVELACAIERFRKRVRKK